MYWIRYFNNFPIGVANDIIDFNLGKIRWYHRNHIWDFFIQYIKEILGNGNSIFSIKGIRVIKIFNSQFFQQVRYCKFRLVEGDEKIFTFWCLRNKWYRKRVYHWTVDNNPSHPGLGKIVFIVGKLFIFFIKIVASCFSS